MPVNDWTRVDAGIFHDFHTGWISEIRKALNNGRLPRQYYALAERHAGEIIPDVLTLQHSAHSEVESIVGNNGDACVAVAEPKIGRRIIGDRALAEKGTPRTLSIRHVSGHRLVAMIEVVSPSNRDRRRHVSAFVSKATAALNAGVHLMIIDLFPPGPFDKHGLTAMIWRAIAPRSKETTPLDKPLTMASMVSMSPPQADIVNLQVGESLPDLALYLKPTLTVDVPLAATY